MHQNYVAYQAKGHNQEVRIQSGKAHFQDKSIGYSHWVFSDIKQCIFLTVITLSHTSLLADNDTKVIQLTLSTCDT